MGGCEGSTSKRSKACFAIKGFRCTCTHSSEQPSNISAHTPPASDPFAYRSHPHYLVCTCNFNAYIALSWICTCTYKRGSFASGE
jgi:hypothetical protein